MAFVPELQRLSILCEILGWISSISHIMFEPYDSGEHVENSTASILCFVILFFFSISMQGWQASSNRDKFDSLLNLLVPYETTATLRTKML